MLNSTSPTQRCESAIFFRRAIQYGAPVTEVVFIDPGVTDITVLLAGLRSGVRGVVLDAAEPAAVQMARVLAGHRELSAVHIIAHGAPGEVFFAGGVLSAESIASCEADLAMIGQALEQDGALGLWCCETGRGTRGQRFVEALAHAVGARVAATSRLVGAAGRGGSWTLDSHPGFSAAQAPLSAMGVVAYTNVMAVRTWSGTTSTDWNLAANWGGTAVPVANDTVIIGTVTNAPTLSVSTPTLGTVTISGTSSLTIASTGVLNLKSNTNIVLSSSGGVVLSGGSVVTSGSVSIASSGGVSGFGTVNAKVNATAAGTGTITASGGTLEIKLAITNAGSLTLSVGNGSSDKLRLDSASAATLLTFSGSTGTVELNNATLTLASALAIGANTMTLVGSSSALTANSGISVGTGTITGLGTVTGAVTATGAAHITANGGKLTIASAIADSGNALILTITGATDNLTLNAASAAQTVTFSSTGTLELNTAGTLTVGTALAIATGTVKLDGSSSALTANSGISVSTGTITGLGTVTGAITASGAAHITANGGKLTIASAIADNGGALILTITGATDNLTLNAASAAQTVTFSSTGTLEVNTAGTLTVGTALAIATGTVKLDGSSSTLTANSGISVSAGTITGLGTVTGAITASGGAHITANGGNLTIASAIADSGNALILTIAGATDNLTLNAASAAHTVTFSSTGTLELNTAGTLTVGTALAVGGGTVKLDASAGATQLTDAAGITLAGGTISGTGGIAASTNISGFGTVSVSIATTGTITATGGAGAALTLAGTVTNRTLLIATGSASNLTIGGTGTVTAAAFTINNANQTLGVAGALTLTGAQSMTLGKIAMAGGTLTDSSGLTVTSGTLSGFGTVAANVSGAGAIAASGGTLEITGTLGGTTALTITGASDTLKLDATSAATSLTFSSTGTLELNTAGTLTLTNALAVGGGTVKLDASAGATQITDAAGITLAGGTISGTGGIAASTNITGFGTVGIPIATTGTITASGGAGVALTLAGTVTNRTLAIATGSASNLTVGSTGTVTAAAFTINNANQTLGVAGALTLTGAQSMTLGKIAMAGGTLTDSSGLTVTSGTLSGFGTVAANLATGAGTITASGGTLILAGTVASGNPFAIATGSASTLQFNNTATAAAAISINNANQTLAIGASGALTISAAESIASGQITLAGGSLTVGSTGIAIGSGGKITGQGNVTGILSGSGSAAVIASGGTLVLASSIAASSGVAYQIADTATSIMKLNGTVGATNTFAFAGTHGAIELNDVTIATNGLNFAGTVSGMTVAVGTATPNLSTIDYLNVQATIGHVAFTDTTHFQIFANDNTTVLGTVTLGSAVDLGTTHVDWVTDAAASGHTIGTGTDIFLSDTVCFAAGTRILTVRGDRMVETLQTGDMVLIQLDGERIARPIVWVGRRRIDLTAHPRPATVAPVRVQRGAFAEASPHTDLLLSPDHAVFVDGTLIGIRQLINGSTIRQEEGWTTVEYFHVELDAHAILIAEGLAVESYLDTGNRGFFANGGKPLVLQPDLTDGSDIPTREASSCAPFVWDEAKVRPVWQRLADRAAALGRIPQRRDTTTDPGLRIVAEGRTLWPVNDKNGRYVFVLPKGMADVRLVSKASAPTDTRPWLEDRRNLGVYVERTILRQANDVRPIPVDHPALSRGWWGVEQEGTAIRRWTDGNAVLPLPAFDGPALLEIHIGDVGMTYVTEAEETRSAGHRQNLARWRVAS